ncbi:hypothetical protein V1512DRAFT_274626 [Lipomyces arxii]|uniref:uncharacterized protein n=1 Tax=Lipomyces arxii TaxID=56418 RepID=UPI0034D01956
MGPSRPLVADSSGVIDLTESDNSDTQLLPLNTESAPASAAPECLFWCSDNDTPRERQSNTASPSVARGSSIGSNTRAVERPAAMEVIDLDDIADDDIPRSEPVWTQASQYDHPVTSVPEDSQDPDFSFLFATPRMVRRLPFPRPTFRAHSSAQVLPEFTTPNDREPPFWGDAQIPIDVERESNRRNTWQPPRSFSTVGSNRSTVAVGGGFGNNISRRRALVTTVNGPQGGASRVVVPLRARHHRHLLGPSRHVLPTPTPRLRSQSGAGIGVDAEQLGRFRREFLVNRPQNFVRPNLDYGDILRTVDYRDFDLDYFAEDLLNDDMIANFAEAMARQVGVGDGERAALNVQAPEVPLPTKGYTRKVRTGMKLVCPDCSATLGAPSVDAEEKLKAAEAAGVPPERDVQGTIWAAKCGHVYCGTCAVKYRKTARRNRKDKLGICVAEDCKQNITGAKGLFEIFA